MGVAPPRRSGPRDLATSGSAVCTPRIRTVPRPRRARRSTWRTLRASAPTLPQGQGQGLRPSKSVAKLESLERAERAALAPAVVLKTRFYILVWYAFSTCLTLYNKTLLGDKLGNFPTPLLMNTVHFALQAALSKMILLFQSKGLDNAVEMGWKDYFMRCATRRPTAGVDCEGVRGTGS
ncbi:hypothetical protein GUJ93_ZPchr0010g7421 [Zizania palustris]|uniref:Sugar phosphate transporter domain-containing protein n=1 Tax=Zizania palustris TaxID=103762 RepID=A0A8J5SZ53_ZIZPA|nr:hypothetical protein GUJ93_ZPchr0010g7421 [Zizania palustris]